MNHHGAHLGIGQGPLERLGQCRAQRLAQRIDRRSSQPDQGHLAFQPVINQCRHERIPEN
ncbi:hypothetical protein D3C79_713840 [compost metagenome]